MTKTMHFNMTVFSKLAAKHGLHVGEVFVLGINTLNALGRKTKYPMRQAQALIKEGADVMSQKRNTVSFARAVEEILIAKAHRRARTLEDIRYITRVFMRKTAGLAQKKLRSITTAKCAKMIEHCFPTPRQRYKARLILHGIFSLALKRGWCMENPVSHVDVPVLKETPIVTLKVEQCQELVQTARVQEQGECLAALGLMLYAGIRPQEVQRLSWQHINLDEAVISIPAMHSKTGGTRHVSIEPILQKLFKGLASKDPSERICPLHWQAKWKAVRQAAGWREGNPWVQDCLRHSYASFHALYYKDFSRLQYEMGHSSSALLRTRYLNMQGLTKTMANIFWDATA